MKNLGEVFKKFLILFKAPLVEAKACSSAASRQILHGGSVPVTAPLVHYMGGDNKDSTSHYRRY
jgi:hypothetical protein